MIVRNCAYRWQIGPSADLSQELQEPSRDIASPVTGINNLPLELLLLIQSYIDKVSATSLLLTCRKFYLCLDFEPARLLRKGSIVSRHEFLKSLSRSLKYPHVICTCCKKIHEERSLDQYLLLNKKKLEQGAILPYHCTGVTIVADKAMDLKKSAILVIFSAIRK